MQYDERLSRIHDTIVRERTRYDVASADCVKYDEAMKNATQSLKTVDAAIEVVRSVSIGLQDDVKNKIMSIVQTALDATFPGYRFMMEFTPRRDKVDTDMFICDANGNKQNVLYGNGGGLKDIVSFALRVAVWSLDKSSSRVIVLDEPMKFMSAGCRYQGAELLDILSRDLGLQFIVVSHVPEIIENGSMVYSVKLDSNGVSKVKLVK